MLRSTNPVDRSTVELVPAEVELVFAEPALELGTAVTVTGPSGEVQTGAAVLSGGTVRQRVAAGAPAGDYLVRWRVTSDDGHPVTGSFRFTAKATGAASPAATVSGAAAPAGSSDGSSTPWVGIVVAAAAGAIGGWAIVAFRRRRAATA